MLSSLSSQNGVVINPAVENNNNDNNNNDNNIHLLMDRESSLKYQTRCIKFFGDTNNITYGIAVGSIEGRVAIEYMDDMGIHCPTTTTTTGGGVPQQQQQPKKYAFKCHRVNDTVYPVNTIAIHPIYNTFATGGADGTVVTWDATNKKKLSNIIKCSTSIAALTYNASGLQLAIASSYTFEEGERDHPREEIYIRNVLDSEVQPKTKK
jgi:cell cycle arrest protein BUB3